MILLLQHHIIATRSSEEPMPITIPNSSFLVESVVERAPASTSSTERFIRVLGFVFHISSVVLAQDGSMARCRVQVELSQSSALISNNDLLHDMAAVRASTK